MQALDLLALASLPDVDGVTSNGSERAVGGPGWDEVTGADLLAREDSQEVASSLPVFDRENFIVSGWTHLLASPPKAGKTTVLLHWIREWLAGETEVLYVSEESADVWRERLASLKGDWSRLRFLLALGAEPEALLERAATTAERVVVVDTIRNLLDIRDENDNSEVARKINPWVVRMRSARKTLILSHHTRKGGGEHGEGITGAHAILASVDRAIEIRRVPNAPRRRALSTYGRVFPPQELMYEMGADDGSLVPIGDPGAVTASALRARLLGVLSSDSLTTAAVHRLLGDPSPSLEQVRRVLRPLAEEGIVLRDPPISVESAKGRDVTWVLCADVGNAAPPTTGAP